MDLINFINECDPDKVLAFPLNEISMTASKPNKLASVKIEIPRNVIDHDLEDKKKWVMMVIAIDVDEYDRIMQ